MTRKNITKTIEAKLASWFKTIKDPQLVEQLEKSVIVTGGCIASMLTNTPVNDYDIYISDREVLMRLCEYYIKNIPNIEILDGNIDYFLLYAENNVRSRAISSLEKGQVKLLISTAVYKPETKPKPSKYKPVFISANAITLSGKIQVIVRFWGEPAEVHSNFDYVHATNYFTYAEGLVLNEAALTSLLTKELKYVGSKYPVASIFRLRKFISRGYYINAGEIFKILHQVSSLDLNDPTVLQDQLAGVDLIEFQGLLNALADANSINYEVISKFIDEIWS